MLFGPVGIVHFLVNGAHLFQSHHFETVDIVVPLVLNAAVNAPGGHLLIYQILNVALEINKLFILLLIEARIGRPNIFGIVAVGYIQFLRYRAIRQFCGRLGATYKVGGKYPGPLSTGERYHFISSMEPYPSTSWIE